LRDDPIAAIRKRGELDGSLDCNAELAQAFDQQALVLVLRKNDDVRERTDARSHGAKVNTRNLPTLDPQLTAANFNPRSTTASARPICR